jgi:enamine deaminase RidA (YjgF/YER057c/UK114 family)
LTNVVKVTVSEYQPFLRKYRHTLVQYSKIYPLCGGIFTDDCVQQVYVNDFSILPEFNKVYNGYFPHKPPRTLMEVSKLPLDVAIEMDVTAII